ncbi:MAG: hypothetical protein ACYDB4_17850 [Candidatus Dormibacteraceae bacterium]
MTVAREDRIASAPQILSERTRERRTFGTDSITEMEDRENARSESDFKASPVSRQIHRQWLGSCWEEWPDGLGVEPDDMEEWQDASQTPNDLAP